MIKPSEPRADRGPVMTGGCQCGRVRYAVQAPLRDLYICHCLECRRQSASAFGISAIVASADLALLSGTPKRFTRSAAVGGKLDCFFCPDCGTRLWHGDPARLDEISVKGGSLDRLPDLSDVKHIWTGRVLPGISIPDHVEQHDAEPPAD